MKDIQTFKQLLKNGNFLKLWTSQMFSQFSINIMNFYILTRIFTVTESSIAVSFMWLAGALPALIFGPFSGAIVDNFSRRRMMFITNLLQALTILTILFVHDRIFFLYIIVFGYWFFDQLYFPSQQSSTPHLVPHNLLTSANGLFLLTQQASVLVGFGLGGILLTLFGSTGTILIATINLVIAAIAVYYLPADSPRRKELAQTDLFRFWKDLLAGYRFLKDHSTVLYPILLFISVQIFISILSTLLPAYVKSTLHLELKHAGTLLIVPGALGALLATYFLPQWSKNRRKSTIIQLGLACAGLSLIAMAILQFFPFRIPLSVVIASLLGGSIAAITIPIQTLIQQRTPPHFQGRIYGQMSFMFILATTLPLVVSATVADILGISGLIGLLGLILLAALLFIRTKGDHVMATSTWL